MTQSVVVGRALPAVPRVVPHARCLALVGRANLRHRTWIATSEQIVWVLYRLVAWTVSRLVILAWATALWATIRRMQTRRMTGLALGTATILLGAACSKPRRDRARRHFLLRLAPSVLHQHGIEAFDSGNVDEALEIFRELREQRGTDVAARAAINYALILGAKDDPGAGEALDEAFSTTTGVEVDTFGALTPGAQTVVTTLAARGRLERTELASASLLLLHELEKAASELLAKSLIKQTIGPTGRQLYELQRAGVGGADP